MRHPLGGIAGIALVLACGSPEPPNVLLVVSDALRADAPECYGGAAATPNLCALAARGVLFERALANAPWTLPSSVAMMTGRHPGQFRRDQPANARLTSFYYVPDEQHLLAEALRERGFRVAALLENELARRANALQGFELVPWDRDGSLEILARFADRLELAPRDDRYLKFLWLLEVFFDPRREPFLLLHWIDDPHARYRPPDHFLEEVADESAALPRAIEYYLGLGHHHRPEKDLRKLRGQAASLSRAEIGFLERLYLLEVASVDERLGTILAALELSGRLDDTIIVFTSDHGEAFGEHGRFLHGDSLYDELVRVPLVLAGPGIAGGRRIATPVSHVDLVPTLAELLSVPVPDVQGRSLVPALSGDRLERRPIYLESPARLSFDGLVVESWKLLAHRDGRQTELYDLDRDPGELRDLSEVRSDVAEQMLAILERVREDNHLRRTAQEGSLSSDVLDQASREILEQMEALGYLD